MKKKIMPPIEKWDRQCVCLSPLNPDLLYIQCDTCQRWFHAACVGITSHEEANKVESFVCTRCNPNQPKLQAIIQKCSSIPVSIKFSATMRSSAIVAPAPSDSTVA